MYDVRFNFEKNINPPVIIKGVPAGYSLLEVALESDISLHHNCGMVCSCSTCHIYINSGAAYLEEVTERETEFLVRAENPASNSRLGCQSVLKDGSGYLEVTIPDQSFIAG
jgi:2Fe-2S ferredoxin